MDDKLDALSQALRQQRVVIVWDNFEVAHGIEGTSVTANLTEDDGAILRRFLKGLRNGASKVLITSRSRERWLGHETASSCPSAVSTWRSAGNTAKRSCTTSA